MGVICVCKLSLFSNEVGRHNPNNYSQLTTFSWKAIKYLTLDYYEPHYDDRKALNRENVPLKQPRRHSIIHHICLCDLRENTMIWYKSKNHVQSE